MNSFVTPLATDWHPLHEPNPLSILLPKITPPSAEATRGDQDQEDSAERRSNGDEDRLVLSQPVRETAIVVARPDVWWTRGSEGVQKRLVLGRVDALQSDLNKVVVGLGDVVCGWEELDAWVGDFVLLAIDVVTEVDEQVGVSEE